jgi:uncharacterized surface protein with fasciclin (FAS1) repeats
MQFRTMLAALAVVAIAAPATTLAHPARAAQETRASRDIVDVAVANGNFNTLAAALTAAGLVDTLKGDGPFTVFAPTDEAFAALPPGTVQRLLKPENRTELRRVLTYHVAPGRISAEDLSGRQLRQATVAGPSLAIDARQGVSVNNARVTVADVAAGNGVIHVIDRVLLPPASH